MALGPVAHGELDAEIGAEADEEDPEGDRDQVERTNDQQAAAAVTTKPTNKLRNTARLV